MAESLSEREAKRKQLEEEFSYDGYKYVRKEFFAGMRDAALTIRDGIITFNQACINSLEDVVYINIMVNEELGRIVVKGCNQNDDDALRWCVAKPDKRKTRNMRCPDFTNLVFDLMKWEKGYKYKMLGYLIDSGDGQVILFDLHVKKIFKERPKRVKGQPVVELTPEEKKGFYSDDIAGTFGLPIEEHDKRMEVVDNDGFISIGAITGGAVTGSVEKDGDSSVENADVNTAVENADIKGTEISGEIDNGIGTEDNHDSTSADGTFAHNENVYKAVMYEPQSPPDMNVFDVQTEQDAWKSQETQDAQMQFAHNKMLVT